MKKENVQNPKDKNKDGQNGKTAAKNEENAKVSAEEKEACDSQDQSQENADGQEEKEEGVENQEAKLLEELQAKYDKLNDTYLRLRAEFDNYRRHSLAEKAELVKNGGEKVLVNILPVIDDFERGLNALEQASDPESVKEGIELVYNKLISFLKQNGVQEIQVKGEDFNTDLHEAIAMIPAPDESQKGKVIDCIQKGYYLNDKVIRYAKVAVGS